MGVCVPNFRSISFLVWPGGVTQIHTHTWTYIRPNIKNIHSACRIKKVIVHYREWRLNPNINLFWVVDFKFQFEVCGRLDKLISLWICRSILIARIFNPRQRKLFKVCTIFRSKLFIYWVKFEENWLAFLFNLKVF